MEYFELIRQWAQERDLYEKGDIKTQCLKLQEEVGELSQAILKDNEEDMIDAIGDCVVVLTNMCEIMWDGDQTIEHCIISAYEEIKDRKGKMNNGTFEKEV